MHVCDFKANERTAIFCVCVRVYLCPLLGNQLVGWTLRDVSMHTLLLFCSCSVVRLLAQAVVTWLWCDNHRRVLLHHPSEQCVPATPSAAMDPSPSQNSCGIHPGIPVVLHFPAYRGMDSTPLSPVGSSVCTARFSSANIA